MKDLICLLTTVRTLKDVDYSSGKAGWLVLEHVPFTNAASQWLYVSLVWRFHTRRGRFSPGTPVSSYT